MNIPTATYRLQFNPEFGFRHAAGIVSFLADLGISHVYASPIFKSRKGSPHGYDGIDPNQLDPELGTWSDFKELHRKLGQHKIGWFQDIVPNHLAFDSDNPMLADVLQNGSFSKYYNFFDIEWDQPQKAVRGTLMAPFLGRRLVQCLKNEELKLRFDDTGFVVTYYDLKLPLKVESYINVLKPVGAKLGTIVVDKHMDRVRFLDVIKRLESISEATDDENRRSDVKGINKSLKSLFNDSALIRQHVEEKIQSYNKGPDDEIRLDAWKQLLSRQVFRLCYWKVAGEEIDYRRFFDINELIGLRQENPDVFETTHQLIKTLVDDGYVNGVRIDHVDGLADPSGYLGQLRDHLGGIYILVEKILEAEEMLPEYWPIQGSTGYDFTQRLNGLFCAVGNEIEFNRIYKAFTGQAVSFENMLHECKRKALNDQLGGELNNLAGDIKRLADRTPCGWDMTCRRIKHSLAETLIHFPVYRTYIDSNEPGVSDRAFIQKAVESAICNKPVLEPELSFIRNLLLKKNPKQTLKDNPRPTKHAEKIIIKFQQLTAPLTAKGLEDTALYIYNRLVSLNEVGGDPRRFGCHVDDFHAFIKNRADRWPHTMNTTATHDSKRGEDVRARINVLSELPGEWENHLNRWRELNLKKKIRIDDREIPDANEEYLLYQILLGTFPLKDAPGDFFIKRISDYLVKAVREAKIHSSWTTVNAEYEEALVSFLQQILHPVKGSSFLKEFLPFLKKVAFYGIWNTLSQTLIKITAPGVPDFYQGSELFDLNLVDPDNRRPVDFQNRKRILAEILDDASSDPLRLARKLLGHRIDGRMKLFLTARALHTRKSHQALFQHGAYMPLAAAGRFKAHVVAFARKDQKHWSITVTPRFLTGMVKEHQNPIGKRVWQDTEIIFPEKTVSHWKNIFTQEILNVKAPLKIGTILQHFPYALLIREDTQ